MSVNDLNDGDYAPLFSTDHRDEDECKSHSILIGEKNKLTTLNGCYIPCLLNIMGIILFERLGWGIGQIGVRGVLIIFFISEMQAIITVLSLSALVTNGKIHGGGLYYIISRSLGPELGGSIGLLFYAAYCVGVAFYCSGFAERIIDTFFIMDTETQITQFESNNNWLIIPLSSFILFICLIISLLGAQCFTKINIILFFFQFLAIFIALIACFFRGSFELHKYNDDSDHYCLTNGEQDGMYQHFEWSSTRFWNIWNIMKCKSCSSFVTIFGVLFPATTGIMEGANLSGDLENPTHSIPIGTLSAIGTSIVFYLLLIIVLAGSFNECTLREDTTIMQEAVWGELGKYLVICGTIISASSSAIGSLFGGSRVLQAIARDRIFPYTKLFEYGTPKGDEPRNAVIFTYIIAQLFVFLGGINEIAPISTSFFCLSYATVNFSCFLLCVSSNSKFKPSFQYYSWHICLIGTIGNLGIMFYVDYKFGLLTILIQIGIFVYLSYYGEPSKHSKIWSNVPLNQSMIYHQITKYLFKLSKPFKSKEITSPNMLDIIANIKNHT